MLKLLGEFVYALVVGTVLYLGLVVVAEYVGVVVGAVVEPADCAEGVVVVGLGEVDLVVLLAGAAGEADVLGVLEVAVGLELPAIHTQHEGVGEVEAVVVELGVGVFRRLTAPQNPRAEAHLRQQPVLGQRGLAQGEQVLLAAGVAASAFFGQAALHAHFQLIHR